MKKKNRLLLVESEMKGPSGHFLDNLIETTNTFRKKLNIDWIVNKDFDHQNTFIPDKIKIFKYISTNKFKRKENKIFYLLEELYLFFLNIYYVFFFFFLFFNYWQIFPLYKSFKIQLLPIATLFYILLFQV